MKQQYGMEQRGRVPRLALGILALGGIACMLVLAAPAPADPSRGQGDSTQAFLSGSERSLSILREIKEVLERIDSRLEQMDSRLEQMDGKLARINLAAGASQAPPQGTMENRSGRDH